MKSPFSFFSRRSETPIETRDYGKIYLVLAGLLFVGTMWAVVDELSTRRPWKETQENFLALSVAKWNDQLRDARAAVDSSAAAALDAELKAAEAKLASPEAVALRREIAGIDESLLDANREFTFAKSRGDE